MPAYWPGGVRREGGASLVCGFYRERGKARIDIAARIPRRGVRAARGSASSGRNREALSTDAVRAGGPARTSGEALVMSVERRGRLICGLFARATGRGPGGDEWASQVLKDKPFQIPEAAGVGGVSAGQGEQGSRRGGRASVEEFEADLKNNLYRIWNRMSSGTYFPPPVRAVEIPKPHGGGTRIFGVPTVADRIAQTVVALRLEPARSRSSMTTRTGTDRGARR